MRKTFRSIFAAIVVCCMLFSQVGVAFAVDGDGAGVIKKIRTELNYLINCDVAPNWAPDVRSEKKRISEMVDSFTSLTGVQKSEFSEKELNNLKAYFTTHFKNEGLDTAPLTELFTLSQEMPESVPESSSTDVSSKAPPESPKASSEVVSSAKASSAAVSSAKASSEAVSSAKASSEAVSSAKASSEAPEPASSIAEPSSEEDKPAAGTISSTDTSSLVADIGTLPKAKPSTDFGVTLLIALIVIAAIAIAVAIWFIFRKRKPKGLDLQNEKGVKGDGSAWFIDYVKKESNESEEAEKKIEDAINAMKSLMKNDDDFDQ